MDLTLRDILNAVPALTKLIQGQAVASATLCFRLGQMARSLNQHLEDYRAAEEGLRTRFPFPDDPAKGEEWEAQVKVERDALLNETMTLPVPVIRIGQIADGTLTPGDFSSLHWLIQDDLPAKEASVTDITDHKKAATG